VVGIPFFFETPCEEEWKQITARKVLSDYTRKISTSPLPGMGFNSSEHDTKPTDNMLVVGFDLRAGDNTHHRLLGFFLIYRQNSSGRCA
jgi:hypothetical protein